jgi:hypothetical protein
MRLSGQDLRQLRQLCETVGNSTWQAMVEGRDHVGGDSFIMVRDGGIRGTDIYVTVGDKPAPAALLDFIAAARNNLPLLLDEIERLQRKTPDADLPA